MPGRVSLHVLGIAGSLRRSSINRGLLRAVRDALPLTVFELAPVPLYNADLEQDLPLAAREFRDQVRRSSAVVLATPEYNYGVSGVLKNAIDWGSQPRGQNVWDGKPVAVLGAANSVVGTARAQLQLRQSLVALNADVFNRELLIGGAGKFDQSGDLVDPDTRQALSEFLAAWVEAVRR